MIVRTLCVLIGCGLLTACVPTAKPPADPLAPYAGMEYQYSAQPGTPVSPQPSTQRQVKPVAQQSSAVEDVDGAALYQKICANNANDLYGAERAAALTGLFPAPIVTNFTATDGRFAMFSNNPRRIWVTIMHNMIATGDSCSVKIGDRRWGRELW